MEGEERVQVSMLWGWVDLALNFALFISCVIEGDCLSF